MVAVFYRHWGPIDRLFFLLPVISYCIVTFLKNAHFCSSSDLVNSQIVEWLSGY